MNDEERQKLAHVWLARATRLLHPGWGGGTPPSISSPLLPLPNLIPSSSGALPQRSSLNHMCQCRACSCSGANCSLVKLHACWWGSPLQPGIGIQSRVAVCLRAWGGMGGLKIMISSCSLFFPYKSEDCQL